MVEEVEDIVVMSGDDDDVGTQTDAAGEDGQPAPEGGAAGGFCGAGDVVGGETAVDGEGGDEGDDRGDEAEGETAEEAGEEGEEGEEEMALDVTGVG